ncbi:hypothetical protein, conserved [Babesia bigemina]|uniref:Uncharacterized protein n=1 Tax=Babesia bigemina TaxID=5866 RepID=A0A061CYL6_BABBI|nr:hypothetical protein, conserved [Babesia bigemina]CDR93731.1 hypothetical protein, conserved [Babesia bigemina]|eukprot:XP_012765917.1 hypothetical protein, conserved [Babesia bigemina]
MWNRARVKTSSLQALAQLSRLSRRYKIEKVQRLSANFERACWRSVRTAEERAYHQKYAFLRHCVDTINFRKADDRSRRVPLPNTAAALASQFTGSNGPQLQKRVQSHIDELTAGLPSCLSEADASLVTADGSHAAQIVARCRAHGMTTPECERAVCALSEIARLRTLHARLATYTTHSEGVEDRCYTKRELELVVSGESGCQ